MKRVPSCFCFSSNSSTCVVVNNPSSTKASAILSPSDLTGGIVLTESSGKDANQFVRHSKVPQQTSFDGAAQLGGGLLVEWIGGRDENRFAHAIKRQNAPTLADIARTGAHQVHIQFVTLQRHKRQA